MINEKIIGTSHQQNIIPIEEVRSIPTFKNLSDDELSNIAESIKEFALILNAIPPA